MKHILVISLILCSVGLAGCGINNDTPIDAAKTFTQAQISGDAKTMGDIDHSGPLEFPAQFVIDSAFKSGYNKYKLSDFSFKQDSDSNVIVVGPKDIGTGTYNLQFTKENGKYYFIGYGSVPVSVIPTTTNFIGTLIPYHDISTISSKNYYLFFYSPSCTDFAAKCQNLSFGQKDVFRVDVTKMSQAEIADLKATYGIDSVPAVLGSFMFDGGKLEHCSLDEIGHDIKSYKI
jgi:hypothetical protein